ncbi:MULTISPECIES: hypothetical protein [Vibrio harveyi group]|uniref:Uncharacterized protein n=1 Tax=Vibrio campbellii TaxID=680 RepID=A0AAQ2Y146_9VIBR|nr:MULTISPECIES: hypothetical protein [Vibrio harveyi group]EHE7894258.1 hypothetical protein [Vibrio parahaemolyticus]EJE4227726.1 hypothetical protein [Vibrio parahaemolyticus]EKI0734759.1 hypothetical protein [Vibrio parahaemolyticus]MBE4144361.1 hypothetical protein [Vibrio parahaemolyticus]MCS0065142.1 hypothetical protein [Vibrio parahaemolyticus]
MSTLKSRVASPRDFVSGIERAAIEEIITQHTYTEVNFNSVRATLPKLLSGSIELVKVNNRVSGDFFACSPDGLASIIKDVFDSQQTALSFFDGMESFETKEKIGMAALDNLHPRASEYGKEDVDTLKGLLER